MFLGVLLIWEIVKKHNSPLIFFVVWLFLFITNEKAFCMYLIFVEHNLNCLKLEDFLGWKPFRGNSALPMSGMQRALWPAGLGVKQWGAAVGPQWEPFCLRRVTKRSRELRVGGYMLCPIAASNPQEIRCFQVVIWTLVLVYTCLSCEHIY